MPVYLFSYHTYRSWMPDRQRGHTRRGEGYVASDRALAEEYAERARWGPVVLDRHLQEVAIRSILTTCQYIEVRCHGIASDPSHLHVLVSWRHPATWIRVRMSIRTYLTRALRAELDPFEGTTDRERPIFSHSSSRKHVKHRGHFDHLMKRYLPSHRGASWFESTDGSASS